jgi:hypothetical protein
MSKFFAYGTRGVSNLVHEPLQFFACDAEVFAPIFDLVVLMHVNATAIRLSAFQNVIWHGIVLQAEQRWAKLHVPRPSAPTPREPLPVTRDAEPAMPDARRKVTGREGQ